MSDFRKLLVWQKAHSLAMDAHTATSAIRGARHSGLKSQIVRAADSVAANIVEGCGEKTALEFTRFLRIALNSATELEYHLIVARDRRLLTPSTCQELSDRAIELRRMLYGLLRRVRTRV
ncbi:MAG: four helix bundle protein [Gemmatimonadaceae bacterium]